MNRALLLVGMIGVCLTIGLGCYAFMRMAESIQTRADAPTVLALCLGAVLLALVSTGAVKAGSKRRP